MTFGKIIILIAICFGLFSLPKVESKFLKFILIGFSLSFISSFFDIKLSFNFSFLTFGLFVFIYFLFSAYDKKWLGTLISLFALISFIFKAQYWPYGSEIRAAMLIPVILFFVTLYNYKQHKDHLYVISILIAYEVSEFLNLLWLNSSFNF